MTTDEWLVFGATLSAVALVGFVFYVVNGGVWPF